MKISKVLLKILTLYFFIFVVLYTALYLVMPFSFNFPMILLNISIPTILLLISIVLTFRKTSKKEITDKDCDFVYYLNKNTPICLYLLTLVISTIFISINTNAIIVSLISMFGWNVFYIFSQLYFKQIIQITENSFRKDTHSLTNKKFLFTDIPESENLVFKILPLIIINLLIGLYFDTNHVGSIIYLISVIIISTLSLIKVSVDLYTSFNSLLKKDYNKNVVFNNEFGNIAYKINTDKEIYNNNLENLEKEKEDKIEKERISSVEMLRRTVDAKDTYTRGHSDRVAEYSVLIGEKLGLSEEDLDLLKVGGLFHDIGKIGIPDKVLLKDGKLTDDEFDEIKKHPAIGAHILENSELFDDLVPMVLHHHEKYNGKGYPDGLKGDNIPYMARIIAVADTFDAMTSKRTYRDPLPLDVVKAEIEKCSGSQFDPKMADAFLNILDNDYDKIDKIMKS